MYDEGMTRLQVLGACRPIHRWTSGVIAVAGAVPLLISMNNPSGPIGWMIPAALAVLAGNGWLAHAMAPDTSRVARGVMAGWLLGVLMLLIGMASASTGGRDLVMVSTALFVASVLIFSAARWQRGKRQDGLQVRDYPLRVVAVLMAFVLWYLAAAAGVEHASLGGNLVQALALGGIAVFLARQALIRRTPVKSTLRTSQSTRSSTHPTVPPAAA